MAALEFGERNLTLPEFREIENISQTTYYELKKAGLAPEELHILGAIRITPDARRAWHQKLRDHQKTDAAKLERARRVEQASVAGKRASVSPTHVSKRGKRKDQPPKRRSA